MPTAPTPVSPAAPAKTVVTPAVEPKQQAHAFETLDTRPNVQKLAPELDAAHVTTLDDDAFRQALDLGSISAEVAERQGVNLTPEEPVAPLDVEAPALEAATAPVTEAPAPEEAPVPTLRRAPETPFTVSDGEGELELPDVFFNFKANGKDYEKVPLDKLVRFAQMGIYNSDKEARYRDVEGSMGQIERRATMAESRVQELEKFYDKLLADPLYYEQASELYSQQNTPEQRIARAEDRTRAMQAQFDLEREELRRAARHEAQAQELQQRYSSERETLQVATFVKSELAPAMERLVAANPLVNEREVLGQYTLLTAPLLDRGRVPPQRLAELKALVDHDLTNWVVAQNAEREYSQRETNKKVQQARAAATTAKRQVARAAAPTGSPASMRPPAPKKYDDVNSWLRDGGGVLPPMQGDD